MTSRRQWKLREKKSLSEDYDDIAPSYDKSRFQSFGGSYIDKIEKQTVMRFLEKGNTLELGTGTGRYGIILTQNNHSFVGIDISKKMLKTAKEKLKNSKKASLVFMDAEKLAFRPGSFDNVICIHTIEYSLSPPEVIKEASKVLTNGGKIVITAESLDNIWHSIGLKIRLENYYERRLFTQRELITFLQWAGFQPTFQGSLFSLPLLFYRNAPKFLVTLAKKIDKLVRNRGTILVSVGKKI